MITTSNDARILGIANPEVICSRQLPPKILIQDPISVSDRSSATGVPIARSLCVSELNYVGGSDTQEWRFAFSGRLSSSSFSYVGLFRYKEANNYVTSWAVHVEQLVSEVFSSTLVSDSPATSNAMANFSENALTRSL
jgi:hypothetical protein